ncbi:3-beta hydroxysteroid dehydrogenase isomerase family protein [Colletotrichum truncatum]|uniref:3-beta hydroxysteroid dehydrogenase isomerase family protein n=1 Tax=Colletotrichum truncatum TaxID=5467 RepID=A0ACC3ZL81_COLTU
MVTGATGFIGAHIVDELLRRGLRVRGATRSLRKGEAMIKARPQYADKLDFVQIEDFQNSNVFHGKMDGIDGVVHAASPFTYDVQDNDKELIQPAKNGVRSIMAAAESHPSIKRVVITSSFAAVMNVDRKAPPYFEYTAKDWNPLTEEEARAPETSPVVAYRASKKYAELTAWEWFTDGVDNERKVKGFDVVTLCPPMTFGPIVHPVNGVDNLNESNAMLWKIAKGETPLPVARVPFWIDVRDLAVAHVEAFLNPDAGGKRYLLGADDRFSYGLAAKIMADNFGWAKEKVSQEDQTIDTSHGLENKAAAEAFRIKYRTFEETVIDLIRQVKEMELKDA